MPLKAASSKGSTKLSYTKITTRGAISAAARLQKFSAQLIFAILVSSPAGSYYPEHALSLWRAKKITRYTALRPASRFARRRCAPEFKECGGGT